MIEPDNLRYTKLLLRHGVRRHPRPRLWNADSRSGRNQKCDQGGAGGRISDARHRGTVPD